jgi:hypothetical protein
VNNMGNWVFSRCGRLQTVTVEWITPLNIPLYVFEYINSTCILHVPVGTKDIYQSAPVWRDFHNIIDDVVAGISAIDMDKFHLYPNPAQENFRISGLVDTALLTLTDTSGRQVLSKQVVNDECIYINTLPNGLYTYQILTVDNRESGKLIKK